MQLKSIFLDMDGTLTNFNINYKIAYDHAVQYLKKLTITDPTILNEYRLDDILKKLKPIVDVKLYNQIQDTFYKFLVDVEHDAAKKSTLKTGVKNFLNIMQINNIKLIVVTNNNSKSTNLTLKNLNIIEYFDFIITRDNQKIMKPDPRNILLAMQKFNVKNNEVIFIGDSWIDIVASNSANIKSIIISTNPKQIKELNKFKPTYIVKSYTEILQILNKIYNLSL